MEKRADSLESSVDYRLSVAEDSIAEPRPKGAELRERTLKFAIELSRFCDDLARGQRNGVSDRVNARQLYRSGSAIGALLEEADAAQSKADFINKCSISLKEARETLYWFRVIEGRHPTLDIARHIDEANQLVSILTTIIRKTRGE